MKLYLRLFHGRQDPAQEMNEWGDDGPFVGPFGGMAWTYGGLRLFDEGDDDFEFLSKKIDDDMIKHDGVWYGEIDFMFPVGHEVEEYKDAISFAEFFGRKPVNDPDDLKGIQF